MAFTSWYLARRPEGEHIGTRLYDGYQGIKTKEERKKKEKEEEEKALSANTEADRQLDAFRGDVASKEYLKSELDDSWLYEPGGKVSVNEEKVDFTPEEVSLLEQYKQAYPDASNEELADIITQAYSANRG